MAGAVSLPKGSEPNGVGANSLEPFRARVFSCEWSGLPCFRLLVDAPVHHRNLQIATESLMDAVTRCVGTVLRPAYSVRKRYSGAGVALAMPNRRYQ